MINKKPLLLLLCIQALLCEFNSLFAKSQMCSDETEILIRQQSPDLEGAPRSATIIEAYYDSDITCVSVTLSNAGTSVTVEFVNHTTNETADYVIPGSGTSFMPISGTSGNWSVTLTLTDRTVYYGEFIIL